MLKRFIAVIISISMIASLAACARNTDNEEIIETPSPTPLSNDNISRGQWITMLAQAVENDLFDDELEDFFSDISDGSQFYKSVQIAALYNWIGVDNDTFNPDADATRSFVAVTTVKALGLIDEPVTELSDIAGEPDADYIRLAVDSEIFTSDNGRFDPNGTVSLSESESIAQKVRRFINFTIDPNHIDVLNIEEDIIDLQSAGNAVTFEDSDAMTVTVSEEFAANLEVGSVYILPPTPEFPDGVARKVTSINRDGDSYVITNEEPSVDELVTELDVQGIYTPDFNNIIWADGVTGEVVSVTGLSSQDNDYTIQNLSFQAEPLSTGSGSFKFNLTDGVTATLDIHSFRAHVSAQKFLFIPLSAMIFIEESHTLTIHAEIEFEKEIPIAKMLVPILPGLTVVISISIGIDGKVSFTIENSMSSETWFSSGLLGLGMSTRTNILENSWNFNASSTATIEAGLVFSVSLNLFGLDLMKGSLFIGAAATATVTFHCLNIDIYIACYLRLAILPQLKDVIDLSVRIDIWDATNSPVRFKWHLENGVLVEVCTRDGEIRDIAELWAMLENSVWINNDDEYPLELHFYWFDVGTDRFMVIERRQILPDEVHQNAQEDFDSWIDEWIVNEVVTLEDLRYNVHTYDFYIYDYYGTFENPDILLLDLSHYAEGVVVFDGKYFTLKQSVGESAVTIAEIWEKLEGAFWVNSFDVSMVFYWNGNQAEIETAHIASGIDIVESAVSIGNNQFRLTFSHSDRGLQTSDIDINGVTTGMIIVDGEIYNKD